MEKRDLYNKYKIKTNETITIVDEIPANRYILGAGILPQKSFKLQYLHSEKKSLFFFL